MRRMCWSSQSLGCTWRPPSGSAIGRLKGVVSIGVGGMLDVLAGCLRRAPPAVCRLGLEALWRVGLSPRRWGRLFRSHPAFLRAVLAARR
ncbi:WecB/TagA/CpsF family glycosyltransferase [bacterium]|nr:WecB/TagA/CpsF family glycosyltransferase [bacterium]